MSHSEIAQNGGGASIVTASASMVATAAVPRGADLSGSEIKGRLCILSRKSLRNITRIPRMARALSEAGFRVTVVSLGAPADELQRMCPAVEYLQVNPKPLTFLILFRLQRRIARQRQAMRRRDAAYRRTLARGGVKAVWAYILHAAWFVIRQGLRAFSKVLVALPSVLLLKKPDQNFAGAWREFDKMSVLQIVCLYLGHLRQPASTREFATEAKRALLDRRFDVVQAHDNYALVAAARLAARDRAKLIYDAVELTSHRLATNFSRVELLREWYERRREAAIFRKAEAMITVGEGLADWYARNYSIRRPLVVRNCRYYWPYEADGRLRADAGVGAEARLVVWFGGAYPQQGIELLIDAVRLMPPSIHVAIVATVMPRWVPFVEGLPRLAAAAGVGERVHILPPREPNDLIPYVSGADLGVIPRPSEYLNNFYSMPNKFLEMIMARLPIAVSRVGDMVEVINKYQIGAVFDERDLSDVAAVIESALEPEIHARLRANVMALAEETTWERESVRYVDLVRSLMPPPADSASLPTAVADAAKTT